MAGWLQYPSETLFAGMAPFWLLAVWVNFAMTLNVSLPWLKGRWILTAALGFVGGPLAYLAGANLNAVVISGPTSFFVLAICWGVLMPLLTALATRFNGF